jgi:hypothetical protein
MSLTPSQCNLLIYYPFSSSQHVSASAGHPQVLVSMLKLSHCIRHIFFLATLYFLRWHTLKLFLENNLFNFVFKISFSKICRLSNFYFYLISPLPWASSTFSTCVLLMCVVVAVFSCFLLLMVLRLPLLFLFSCLRVGVPCVVWWTFYFIRTILVCVSKENTV